MNTQIMDRPAQQLEHAVITVQYVNEKKAAQRNANIKDVDGAYYWVKPEDLHIYQVGGVYEISFSTTQSNGYTNRTIKSAAPIQQSHAALPPRAVAQTQRQPVRQSAPIEPRPQPNNNNSGFYRPTSPEDKKSMFRCACVAAAIRSGQLRPSRNEIASAIMEIDAAYDEAVTTLNGLAG